MEVSYIVALAVGVTSLISSVVAAFVAVFKLSGDSAEKAAAASGRAVDSFEALLARYIQISEDQDEQIQTLRKQNAELNVLLDETRRERDRFRTLLEAKMAEEKTHHEAEAARRADPA